MRVWEYDIKSLLKKIGYAKDLDKNIIFKLREELRRKIRGLAEGRIPKADRFINSISININADKLSIVFADDITYYREVGTKPRKMLNLLGKTVPIKDKKTNSIVFRKVTLKGLLNGWYHPGTDGLGIVQRAMQELDDEIVTLISNIVGTQNAQT